MTAPLVHVEIQDGIAWLTLNRPEKRNALTVALTDELAKTLDEVGANSEVRCIVLTGAGSAFCAGRDVGELNTHLNDRPGQVSMPIPAGGMAKRLAATPQIIISMINGPAIGEGLDLALCCDLAIAADDAALADPHLARGVVPSAGAWNLPRLVSAKKATEMLLFGLAVSGTEAAELGLVNRSVPSSELRSTVEQVAAAVASLAPTATQFTKRAIEMGKTASRDHTMEFVTFARSVAAKTGDVEEFTKDFLAKANG